MCAGGKHSLNKRHSCIVPCEALTSQDQTIWHRTIHELLLFIDYWGPSQKIK